MVVAEERLQVKKIWYLKNFKIFSNLSWQERNEFSRTTRMISYRKSERMFFPGDDKAQIYLLQEGQAKISKVRKDGRESTLVILEPGEIFGEMNASRSTSYESIVEAIDPMTVCEIPRNIFDNYLQTYPDSGGKVVKVIGGRVQQLETRVHDLVFKSASARLASLLVRLSETMGTLEHDAIRLPIRLTHQNLGHLIGVSCETVSTLMGQFAQYGLLKYERRSIRILDKSRLANVQ
ncbi:MAG: Crp/Fnr family transcriptional regulator [Nitrospirales bacterium]|nr:MAG: Crp/Fnr family transcriptional regulator [Nitrospirales bacterium]